jgi:hypothetical protein
METGSEIVLVHGEDDLIALWHHLFEDHEMPMAMIGRSDAFTLHGMASYYGPILEGRADCGRKYIDKR